MKKTLLTAAAGAFALAVVAFTGSAQAQCWWTGLGYSCAAPTVSIRSDVLSGPVFWTPATPYPAWNSYDYQDYRARPLWLPSYPGPRPAAERRHRTDATERAGARLPARFFRALLETAAANTGPGRAARWKFESRRATATSCRDDRQPAPAQRDDPGDDGRSGGVVGPARRRPGMPLCGVDRGRRQAFSVGRRSRRRSEREPRNGAIVNRALLKNTPFSKPIVAAVNGDCVAGGLELLLSTDIRAAAPEARFGLPEVSWSIYPFGGATVKLAQQIGHVHAMDLLLTGRLVDADFAERVGLINP